MITCEYDSDLSRSEIVPGSFTILHVVGRPLKGQSSFLRPLSRA